MDSGNKIGLSIGIVIIFLIFGSLIWYTEFKYDDEWL